MSYTTKFSYEDFRNKSIFKIVNELRLKSCCWRNPELSKFLVFWHAFHYSWPFMYQKLEMQIIIMGFKMMFPKLCRCMLFQKIIVTGMGKKKGLDLQLL